MINFTPQSFTCWKEGYSKTTLINDLFAGISVGIIALPLAIAFAIASGVDPDKGLFTAIAAGFLTSLLSGSRVQIGGPTGAFVVIVYAVVQKHGYDGLALATLIAAIMMILMGVARMGVLLKFIPFTVTTGFTTGIAVVIFISQIKDFFGLEIDRVPPDFLEKCKTLCLHAYTWNVWAFLIATSTFITIYLIREYYPRLPGALLAIIAATLVSYTFQLPLATVESKFGEIPHTLPIPALPHFSWELFQRVFPDAVTIALLGAIESLLCAVVADGMTGHKHRSNCELIAQGIANIGSILFGGIPATGAIARTSANIRLGATTPLAGMMHAITLLLLMLLFAPLAGKIPLAALSGLLVFIAWNMSELPHFIALLKGKKGEALVLLTTFLLTVFIDLAVAVQVGVVLSAVVFLKHMTDKTAIEACKMEVEESGDETEPDDVVPVSVPSDTVVYEIIGPFFYSVADQLDEALIRLGWKPRVFILRLHRTPLIDATGIKALKDFGRKCQKQGILFLMSDIDDEKKELFKRTNVEAAVGKEHLFTDFNEALKASIADA